MNELLASSSNDNLQTFDGVDGEVVGSNPLLGYLSIVTINTNVFLDKKHGLMCGSSIDNKYERCSLK